MFIQRAADHSAYPSDQTFPLRDCRVYLGRYQAEKDPKIFVALPMSRVCIKSLTYIKRNLNCFRHVRAVIYTLLNAHNGNEAAEEEAAESLLRQSLGSFYLLQRIREKIFEICKRMFACEDI
uniref:Uncharacterized protein n=1 Tax=Glossina austeni TaxID=7395 RepID=A0A1A9VVP1_GLOAU